MNTAKRSDGRILEINISGSHPFKAALAELEAHARGMWRFRWKAILVAWLICFVGWPAIYSMPPVYQANARIFVDTENALRPLVQGIASSSNVMNEVAVVTREMLSRPNLAEVARVTDLDLRVKTKAELEALLSSLQSRISVSGNRANIFTISFQDQDNETAVAVVDSLVNTFVEKSLGADRTESSKAQEFLQTQIGEYEARLTAAEDKLARFRRDNVAFMPDQRGDYFARLQAAESRLSATETRLRLAEERRAELLRQIEGEEPVFGIMPTADAEIESGFKSSKIIELESELEELRLQYTDKHPKIGQILSTIELLKQQQAEERNSQPSRTPFGSTPAGPSSLDQNPVFQNMRIQLTNTEVEIASLRAERSQNSQQVTELRTLIDTVPQVEAELGRLNRDYGIVKGKYEQLVAQLETAQLGEDVDESMDDVQFRIIDPPFAGSVPAGPKRQLFMIALLLAALGTGVALSFLMNQLKPVFFSGHAVTQSTGVPVLGAVSLLIGPAEKREKYKGRALFSTVVVALFLVSSVLAMFAEPLSLMFRGLIGASA